MSNYLTTYSPLPSHLREKVLIGKAGNHVGPVFKTFAFPALWVSVKLNDTDNAIVLISRKI